jgi:dTDP-4-amino-4,6-dideoxygalactose transaminase
MGTATSTTPFRIKLARSVVGREEAEALARVIDQRYLAMGAEVQAFERELAAYLSTSREVMCVNSGTAALHLALQACGIGPGDEVLVPTLTYIATFQAVSATGATPVACDVREDSAWLDTTDAARRVTDRTRAIIPVHFAGGTGDLQAVYDMARTYGLRVIEDAAQALGCHYRGRLVGTAGDITCLSFDGIKHVTAGEGGAVVTADEEVAERVKDARLLAIQKDTDKRFAGQRSWEFDVTDQGWRFHMSNLFASIGRVQLRRFVAEFRAQRVALAKYYQTVFSSEPQIRLLDLTYGEDGIVPFSFHVFLPHEMRNRVLEALLAEGIECGIHYKPNHLLTKYRRHGLTLPVAERLHREVIALPFWPELATADQDLIVDVVRRAIRSR